MVYSADMASGTDDPSGDFDKLARRYLDLWQSQLSGLAADQALTEQIARLFAVANAQVASAIQAAQGAPHANAPTGNTATGDTRTGNTTTGTASAAASS